MAEDTMRVRCWDGTVVKVNVASLPEWAAWDAENMKNGVHPTKEALSEHNYIEMLCYPQEAGE